MHNENTPIKAGLLYSKELALLFGLPLDQSVELRPPLLGVALEIKKGSVGGHMCRLHVYYDAKSPVRLPAEDQLYLASAQLEQLPYGIIRKPSGEVRRFIGTTVRNLASRAIARFGTSKLISNVVASKDPNAAYVSMPLDGYHKNFVPGVSWLVMPINCALAARQDFYYVSLFLEKSHSPENLIMNELINPNDLIELTIPIELFNGVHDELERAVSDDVTSHKGRNHDWCKLIKSIDT
jgi:hypothetical protein